ncbi:hypothetical protein EJF18_10859 [Clavispora lusitaniae]|uniref:Uncharacterized protein n=1 Tax=Clavispora lusitaniae TaxID=36911 RepID=A0ACD0WF45_CLALS|nr:hypothetical protein EJF14_10859 [Clavispora lusitaniae]QFZ30949.1 hypothetical protein EJF16_10859 [Clavispora lusitaniae]QFZ36617.1 hypothetical protein EJF15_10859 [Clavispora lusitaniae]QFZ42301.1 hypothetical protein EJF18_10859 [Clavispora lusitaniae]QFZ47977.1 hypothetical protein EJF17_10859 [Clavispora lusitaniae]
MRIILHFCSSLLVRFQPLCMSHTVQDIRKTQLHIWPKGQKTKQETKHACPLPYFMFPSRTCFQASAQFKSLFRSSMSRIASQAMILTAGCENASDNLHGMTLSSVCSLSVFPRPLLQFNLHLPSYTASSLHSNGGYLCLHVMPPTEKAVFLSRIFASGVKTDPEHFESKGDDGEVFHEMTTPFSHLSPTEYYFHQIKDRKAIESLKVPVLKESEVAFICQKEKVVEIDNHEIWVVGVTDILLPNSAFANSKTGGLLYFDRGFHEVGPPLRET